MMPLQALQALQALLMLQAFRQLALQLRMLFLGAF
jgi:hypothetical protein